MTDTRANKEKSEEFLMKPCVDWCFKELMRNPKTRQGFIAELLKLPPKSIRKTVLLETELPREALDDKLGILDVHVLMEDGTQIDMEMQMRSVKYLKERNLFYLGKLYTGQIKRGESYQNLKKCIHVSILNFTCFPDDVECWKLFHFRDDKTGELYSDRLEIQVLELPKVPSDYQSPKGVIAWMKFFRAKDRKELEEMTEINEYIKEAYEDLKKLSMDESKRLQYEAREKALMDYCSEILSAREEGEEIGEERGRMNMLLELCREGILTVEQAAEKAGIPAEEVKKLL